jgi:hypothetical protein
MDRRYGGANINSFEAASRVSRVGWAQRPPKNFPTPGIQFYSNQFRLLRAFINVIANCLFPGVFWEVEEYAGDHVTLWKIKSQRTQWNVQKKTPQKNDLQFPVPRAQKRRVGKI